MKLQQPANSSYPETDESKFHSLFSVYIYGMTFMQCQWCINFMKEHENVIFLCFKFTTLYELTLLPYDCSERSWEEICSWYNTLSCYVRYIA
jgi:hypothetical protein